MFRLLLSGAILPFALSAPALSAVQTQTGTFTFDADGFALVDFRLDLERGISSLDIFTSRPVFGINSYVIANYVVENDPSFPGFRIERYLACGNRFGGPVGEFTCNGGIDKVDGLGRTYTYGTEGGPIEFEAAAGDSGGPVEYTFRLTGPNSDVAIPEPATWALMVGGFGLVGSAVRRRNRASLTYA